MVTTAIIVASDRDVSPLTQLGGLSLLKRAVLTARKAGVTTCYILCSHEHDELQRELQQDARVTIPVVWIQPGDDLSTIAQESACFMFAVHTVFRHPLLQSLSPYASAEKTTVVADAAGSPLLAVLPGVWVGEIVAELAQGKSLQETTLLTGSVRVPAEAVAGHFIRRLTARAELGRVEHELLLSLENPRDGQVDTYFNRKLSRPITRWFLRTPLSPNQITVLSCVVGLLGALCFFPGGYWGPLCGALLLQFSVVLDCCDGEVARVKFMESPLGDWLDIVCDTVVSIAIFLGLGVAVWRDGTTDHALALAGMLAVGGVLAFPFVTLAEKTEEAGNRRGGWEDGLIKKLLASLTTRDFSVLILASALAGRLTWFLWGAAVGAHVFWLFLAWLLFRAGRFDWARRPWEGKEI
jgi:phosphatidylglycerophosphate synthase